MLNKVTVNWDSNWHLSTELKLIHYFPNITRFLTSSVVLILFAFS